MRAHHSLPRISARQTHQLTQLAPTPLAVNAPAPAAAMPPIAASDSPFAGMELGPLGSMLLLAVGGIWETIAGVGELVGLPRLTGWPAG